MVDIADIYIGLLNHYKWKYVSLIVQNENLYTVVSGSSVHDWMVIGQLALLEYTYHLQAK